MDLHRTYRNNPCPKTKRTLDSAGTHPPHLSTLDVHCPLMYLVPQAIGKPGKDKILKGVTASWDITLFGKLLLDDPGVLPSKGATKAPHDAVLATANPHTRDGVLLSDRVVAS